MKIFVTGGTGTVGAPVVAELLANGHSVLALARSDKSAQILENAGAEVLRGELADLNILRSGAEKSDGVISLAFTPDYSTTDGLTDAVEEESAATIAMGEALVGTDKPIVITSGTPWMPGKVATEADPLVVVEGPLAGRAHAQEALLAMASRGVRSCTIRLPRTVHNNGKGGFAGLLTEMARKNGTVGYPGDGNQRWPAVHALDAAILFRLALESAPAGTAWHAVADEGDKVSDIAKVIGRRLDLEVKSVSQETFGPFGPIFAMDQPASSAHTREVLSWQPTHPNLLEDLENIQR
jgi:nucleoside-diphosphate-sugar epimerase